MLISIGHFVEGDGPVVTETRILGHQREDGTYYSSYIIGTDAAQVREHLNIHTGAVAHLPGNTAILDTLRPIQGRLQGQRPNWVAVDAEDRDKAEAADFERFLSEFWGCPAGRPEDLEDTHWTLHGGVNYAPGEIPEEG